MTNFITVRIPMVGDMDPVFSVRYEYIIKQDKNSVYNELVVYSAVFTV